MADHRLVINGSHTRIRTVGGLLKKSNTAMLRKNGSRVCLPSTKVEIRVVFSQETALTKEFDTKRWTKLEIIYDGFTTEGLQICSLKPSELD